MDTETTEMLLKKLGEKIDLREKFVCNVCGHGGFLTKSVHEANKTQTTQLDDRLDVICAKCGYIRSFNTSVILK